MSLTDSLSALRQALQTESPSPAQIQDILDLWVLAEQRALSGKLGQIQQLGEAQIAQKAAAMRAELEANQAESLRIAERASHDLLAQMPVSSPTESPKEAATSAASPELAETLEVEMPETSPEPPAVAPATPERAPSAERTAPPAAAPKTTPAASAKSVNARYAVLKVGLNDRVAFVKHLFDGVDDDFQRVVAALATMESKQECETFLENAVYGDYDWSQKPEIAERFLALVFARFE